MIRVSIFLPKLFIPISYRGVFMDDIIILGVIAIFTAAAFVLSFMRLWFVTHYDANLGNKVKGISLDFAKLRKELRTQLEQSSRDLAAMEQEDKQQSLDLTNVDLSSMTLEEAAESMGIDPDQLNNPLIRPMAEKVFEQIKAKAKSSGSTDDHVGY